MIRLIYEFICRCKKYFDAELECACIKHYSENEKIIFNNFNGSHVTAPKNFKSMECCWNKIKSIDVGELEHVSCEENIIKYIDVKKLIWLRCGGNKIRKIKINLNNKIKIGCANNRIKEIKLDNNYYNVYGNKIKDYSYINRLKINTENLYLNFIAQ